MTRFESELLYIIPRTHDVSSFRFGNPLNIPFKAGQYLTLTINAKGEELIHAFSISNSPTEKGYFEVTTKLRDSKFKKALRNLKVGDRMSLQAPFGHFTLNGSEKKVGMLAGGVGISPLRSMIKYCTDKKLDVNITLLYGNHSEGDIIFKEDLEKIRGKNRNLKVVYTLNTARDNWRGHYGFIDANLIKEEIPDFKERYFFSCGPPMMVKTMVTILHQLDVKKDKIKIEHFAGY